MHRLPYPSPVNPTHRTEAEARAREYGRQDISAAQNPKSEAAVRVMDLRVPYRAKDGGGLVVWLVWFLGGLLPVFFAV